MPVAGFGPSAHKYLMHIYSRARENSCSGMGTRQPDNQTIWNVLHASTYWNMRLGVAGAAKDAQVQSGILLNDFTRIIVVVGRQPDSDPNFSSYVSSECPHRLAVALPYAAFGLCGCFGCGFLLAFALSSSISFYFYCSLNFFPVCGLPPLFFITTSSPTMGPVI